MQKKRLFKQIGMLGLVGTLSMSMVGCSKLDKNNLDFEDIKTTDTYVPNDSLKELEIMNLCNDTEMFIELNNNEVEQIDSLSKESISKDEKNAKMYMILNDYVQNVYQLASSRLSSDIETVYVNSEEYMAYLAMLQTFVDEYTREKDAFQTQMAKGEMSITNLSSYQAFLQVEAYYIDIYESSMLDGKIEDEKADGKKEEEKNEGKPEGKPSLDDLINKR